MTKGNLRLVTKEVNPVNLAVWTFVALDTRLREWAYEIYDTLDHPALSTSPREAFLMAQTQTGARLHRIIHNLDEFEILTLPTTAKGAAKVIPGRGVKINYIFYWCESFRDAALAQEEVPVRYDPFNLGRAYAYVHGHWQSCHSEHYLQFEQRTERELMIAAAEMRRRHQQHRKRMTVTAHQLARFLSSVEAEEATLQQRLRDAEARRSRQQTASSMTAGAPTIAGAASDQTKPHSVPPQTATSGQSGEQNFVYFTHTETYDPTELEIYEEY